MKPMMGLLLLGGGVAAAVLLAKKSDAAPGDPQSTPGCPPGYGLNNLGQCVPLVGPPLPPPPPPPPASNGGGGTAVGPNVTPNLGDSTATKVRPVGGACEPGWSLGPDGYCYWTGGDTTDNGGDGTAVTGFRPRPRGFPRRARW